MVSPNLDMVVAFLNKINSYHTPSLGKSFAFRILKKNNYCFDTFCRISGKNSFNSIAEYLIEENTKGAEVYFIANSFGISKQNRGYTVRDASIEQLYFAYADIDYTVSWNSYTTLNSKLTATCSETSVGKFQMLIPLVPCRPTKLNLNYLKDIAILFAGDSIGNPSRILRIPGLINHKRNSIVSPVLFSANTNLNLLKNVYLTAKRWAKSSSGIKEHTNRVQVLGSLPLKEKAVEFIKYRVDIDNFSLLDYKICTMRGDTASKRLIKRAGWDIDVLYDYLVKNSDVPKEHLIECGYRHKFVMTLVGEAAYKISKASSHAYDQSNLAKDYIDKILFMIKQIS